MKVDLIDHMGTDLTVVNSARVSFAKESNWGAEFSEEHGRVVNTGLVDKDIKLIKYLAKHNHWTPFSHVQITMRETVPIFVARQRFKHMVGFTYNEVSRRYVDTSPEFFHPDVWRGKPVNAKQGSDGVVEDQQTLEYYYEELLKVCQETYEGMLAIGVAPEQARMVLPQSMYTEYYVTGSLSAWARAYNLRSEEHAQFEIRELAGLWKGVIGGISELTHSWKALLSE